MKRMRVLAESTQYLYHVTYLGDLPSIQNSGLQAGGGQTFETMENYSVGRLFFTDEDGLSFWNQRYGEWAEHRSDNPIEQRFIPITLRMPLSPELESNLQQDELGTGDANAESFYVEDGYVAPEAIEAYDGTSWVPIAQIDPEALQNKAEDAAEIDEEDGEELLYPDFDVFSPS